MQIGAGLIRMSATHSLQIVSTEYFFLLKNFVLLQIYFYFPIFEKYNSKMEEFSSRIIHSGTSHCPGMDMAGTRDISFHSGTVPDNPGHLVTLVARQTFQSFNIINEDVTVIKLTKPNVVLDKPIYVGMCILDLSKLHLYDFHYNHILSVYGERAKLLFTDTDSLTYHIRTDDLYKDMLEHLNVYDTSDYPVDHFLHSKTNAKVIGKFKDETNGVAPLEFVGLRSKMYSLLLPNNKEKKTAKGVKKSYVAKNIRHEHYKQCLFDEKI